MKPAKQNKHPDPIKKKEEIQQNPDKRIDQDFEGYPNHPANDKIINPENNTEKKTAGIHPKSKARK